MDTNAILGVACILISQFSEKVGIPAEEVPRDIGKIERLVMGSPASPFEIYIATKSDYRFWIRDGMVRSFASPDSYFQAQEPSGVRRFAGLAKLSRDEAVDLGTRVLQRFVKRGEPLRGVPTVQSGGVYEGSTIPFYRISWSPEQSGGYGHSAQIDIDARGGQIVGVDLAGPHFFEPLSPSETAKWADALDAKSRPEFDNRPGDQGNTSAKRVLKVPSRSEAARDISNWARFRSQLDMPEPPGGVINNIDWERTVIYTNEEISVSVPITQMRFLDGTCFEAVNGLVFSHFSPDSCFTGFWGSRRRAEWSRFEGTIQKDWRVLAADLERLISSKLGVARSTFSTLRQWPMTQPLELGEYGTARLVVYWCKWPKDQMVSALEDVPVLMRCEFDLETGEKKWFEIHPVLLGLEKQTDASAERLK